MSEQQCANCQHWAAPTEAAHPHKHFGHDLRRCLFFTQAAEGQQPHAVSLLATVTTGWDEAPAAGYLMTAWKFSCIEWVQAVPVDGR